MRRQDLNDGHCKVTAALFHIEGHISLRLVLLSMSTKNNDVPQEFYDVVDKFIDLANELGTTWPRSRVSATLMFAAARYNVYNWLAREVELEQTLEQASIFYRTQYEEMFRENVRELTPVYTQSDQPPDTEH